MQDRFKMRIFSKTARKFIYFDNAELCIDRENMGLLFRSEHLYMGNYEDLQQCTGLKDKNGNLIYEGDIVRYRKCEYSEEWDKSQVIWYGDDNYPAFDLTDGQFDTSNGLSYLIGDNWEVEVIGNIYENPELLEQEND